MRAFPLLAAGFGCLLLSATAHRGWLRRRIPGMSWLAMLAYSLYLTHKSVAHLVQSRLPAWVTVHSWLVLVVCGVASCMAAAVLYFFVERPALQLRSWWLDHRRAATETQTRLDPAL